MSKGAAIFGWVRLLAPIILARIPQTAPIAAQVAAGLDEAEALSGASGKAKLVHVQNLATLAAQAVNAEKPGAVDVDAINTAVAGSIQTAFEIAKVVELSHGAPALPAVVEPSA
jgi:hypothetical protein